MGNTTNNSTMSAIFGRIDKSFDRIDDIFHGTHRGRLNESFSGLPAGTTGSYTLDPSNINYAIFTPDGQSDALAYRMVGSIIGKE